MGAVPLCTLKDCTAAHFSDEEGFLPPVPGDVYSVIELVDYLRAAATRRPHVVHMTLPGLVRVAIDIGGPWAAITWCHLFFGRTLPADHPPSWYARPARPLTTGSVAFLTGGGEGEDDIGADRLLPAEEVIWAAVHIATRRALPGWLAWVSSRGDRYGPVAEAEAEPLYGL